MHKIREMKWKVNIFISKMIKLRHFPGYHLKRLCACSPDCVLSDVFSFAKKTIKINILQIKLNSTCPVSKIIIYQFNENILASRM